MKNHALVKRAIALIVVFLPVTVVRADVLIHTGRLLDVKKGHYLENQGVLIAEDKIIRIDRWSHFDQEVQAKIKIVDLSDQTVLPGLIDAHTHLLKNTPSSMTYEAGLITKSVPYRALEGAAVAKITLEAGFTSVRDVESEGAGFADAALRDAIDNGLVPGPRMQVATKGIAALGNYYPFGIAPEYQLNITGVQYISGPEEARRAVREQIQGGADLIKLYADFSNPARHEDSHPTLSLEEIRMIVAEAHRARRKVAAHATTAEGVRNAVNEGVDSIEHGWLTDVNDLKLMVSKKVVLVPTTHFLFEFLEESKDPKMTAKMNLRITNLKTVFKRASELGLTIACGSDAAESEFHGKNAKELASMVRLGMSPLEAIKSATLNGAALMNLSDKIGSLETGKQADLIAVRADPLKDVTSLQHVSFVMKAGKVYKSE